MSKNAVIKGEGFNSNGGGFATLHINGTAYTANEVALRVTHHYDLLTAGKRVLNYATLDEILADQSRDENHVFGIRIGDLRLLSAAISKAEG